MRLLGHVSVTCVATSLLTLACSSAAPIVGSGGQGGSTSSGLDASTGGGGKMTTEDAGAVDASPVDAADAADASVDDGGMGGGDAGAMPVDTLTSNRDRLLQSYYDYLEANVSTPQSNGLSGSNVGNVCDVWSKLDPSARAVFLTLSARLQGSHLGADGSSMLWHVTKVYRIAGGQGATANDPGACGGEGNRMFLSMDTTLHAALLAANQHQGATLGNGLPDIADIPPSKPWRDSHDLAGAHAPFDTSDETEAGAPRAQTHYFADPTKAPATMPLGRVDVMSLVDPLSLEMDQDYDCVHNSNPICSYITYGPFCLPMPNALGTKIYEDTYGDFDASYQPSGCGP